jgi:hypothetical protein
MLCCVDLKDGDSVFPDIVASCLTDLKFQQVAGVIVGRLHRASRSSERICVDSVPPLNAPVANIVSYSGKSLRVAHLEAPPFAEDVDFSSAAMAASRSRMVSCVTERLWAAAICLNLLWSASGNDLMTSAGTVAIR